MLYTELLLQLEQLENLGGVTNELLNSLSNNVQKFKHLTQQFFEPYVENGLFTLKFHLLDHLVHDLSRYCSLEFLSASPYEYYNTRIKQNYRKTLKLHGTVMEETVERINREIDTVDKKDPDDCFRQHSRHGQNLGSRDNKLTLRELRAYVSTGNTEICPDLALELQDNIPQSDLPVLLNLIDEQVRANSKTVLD